ncbi:HAD-like domain-containing protein [Mycena sp. CBHHK59/15]|nr:HAD-like domain-containing protein [Mycena sp. CBHHK59/15]
MSLGDTGLTDFKAIIFDCYGTLADWETGIYDALRPTLARFPSSRKWTRKEALLSFTSIEKDLQVKDPSMLYCDLLAKAHEHKAFGNSIKDWPVFPDTCGALRLLEKHYKLVILSNVDRESFSRTHIKLSQGTDLATYTLPVPNPNAQWLPKTTPNSASPFSLILTAQDTGVYKPDPRGMLAALGVIQEEFGIGKEQVLVVAQSLYHDVEPSSKLGVSSVWIDRQGATMGLETIDDAPKWRRRFETLGGMAKAVEEEKLQRD